MSSAFPPLTPTEFEALPPEEQDRRRRAARLEDDDFNRLTQFVNDLEPLCRKYRRAEQTEHLDPAHMDRAATAWDRLVNHLLSLPTYAEGDAGWLPRVQARQKGLSKSRKALVKRNKAERRKAVEEARRRC